MPGKTERNPNNIQIGERLTVRRKMLHMTQADVAEIVKVSRGQYSQWEQGYNALPLTFLTAVAKALRVLPDYILGDDDTPDPESAMYLRKMSPDLRPTAREYLKHLYEISDQEETDHGSQAV